MADALYMRDSYLKEFDAVIKDVKEDKFIVLDRTAFYPRGGGQPHDTGILRKEDGTEFKVIFVGKFGGEISHEIDTPGLKVGDKVRGVINWDRRYKFMRMHTACHVLSSIFHKKCDAKITGNQLNEERSRIDFNLENFDKVKILSFAEIANKKIEENQNIKVYFKPRDEVMKDPNMVRLANALPPNVQELRIVEIGDIDTQADGGTHVKNTSEIGKIVITKMENKGKSNRRAYFVLE